VSGEGGSTRTALPLFPLGSVLLPGLLLPLQIFEPRYRVLIEELLRIDDGQPRRFGVVALRRGGPLAEVSKPARAGDGTRIPEFHPIGCTAHLRRVDPHADGRFSIVTSGEDKFRVLSVDAASRPYLVADVEFLADGVGDAARAAQDAPAVARMLRAYTSKLVDARAMDIRLPELPDDPRLLSYVVAATIMAQTSERQALLATPDAASRLRAERALLHRELVLLESIVTVTTDELVRTVPNPN
jgi:uncharacterized protein